MGCGGSTNGNLSPDKEGGRRGSIFRKEPKVTIRIGDGVKVLNRKPRVIFVFGKESGSNPTLPQVECRGL